MIPGDAVYEHETEEVRNTVSTRKIHNLINQQRQGKDRKGNNSIFILAKKSFIGPYLLNVGDRCYSD